MAEWLIVEYVYDAEEVARHLERGDAELSPERLEALVQHRAAGEVPQAVRQRGEGTFTVAGPFRMREEAARLVEGWRLLDVPGATLHVRSDFDPDWSRQAEALAEAHVEGWRHRDLLRMAAIPALNAFKRSYFNFGPEWDLADPIDKPWSAADRRNFSDGAAQFMHALAGQRLTGPSAAAAPADYVLRAAVEYGWADAGDKRPEPVNGRYNIGSALELAYGLAYVMRRHGEPHLDWLYDTIERGAKGDD